MKRAKALFVPLLSEWFDAFACGRKRIEYRVHGPRWNKRVCWDGRCVVLAKGYGWPRLHARILRTQIIPSHRAPKKARAIFGDRELIAIHVYSVHPIERAAWEVWKKLAEEH